MIIRESPIGQGAGLMPILMVLMIGSRRLLRDKKDHIVEGWVRVLFDSDMYI